MSEDFVPDYGADWADPDIPHVGDGQWCFDPESIPVYLLMLNTGRGELCSRMHEGFSQAAQDIAHARGIPGPFKDCTGEEQRE
jgi:hypothetical protein